MHCLQLSRSKDCVLQLENLRIDLQFASTEFSQRFFGFTFDQLPSALPFSARFGILLQCIRPIWPCILQISCFSFPFIVSRAPRQIWSTYSKLCSPIAGQVMYFVLDSLTLSPILLATDSNCSNTSFARSIDRARISTLSPYANYCSSFTRNAPLVSTEITRLMTYSSTKLQRGCGRDHPLA